MSDDIVENLTQPSQWLRVLFMIVMVVALYVVGLMLTLVTVGQVVFSLVTGANNDNLRVLGRSLTLYVKQILDFLTYNSEIKPFPFSAYPDAATVDSESDSGVDADDMGMEVWVSESDSASANVVSTSARKPRKRATRKTDATQTPADSEES
jgi:Domain of unknown function (DUF4389)